MSVGANAGLAQLGVNVNVNLSQFDAGMRQVEQRGQQVTGTLNKLGSALAGGAAMGAGFAVASAALSTVAGVAEAAGSAVIGLNSKLEQARIGFTAFTGSVEKSNAFVKQLQDFAARTTFEFPGLLQAARQLTGMGVQAEMVIPILKDVAGAVMAVGGGDVEIGRVNRALTQMMAAGKVNAQDMNQLAQAGIPAWKMLADSMGLTIGQVRKLSEEGQISAEQMLGAFHKFVQDNGLADAATKAGQTWQAATSNIIDGLRNMGAEGFEPLFNIMRDFAVQLANMLTGPGAKDFTADLKATVQDVIETARPLGDIFNRAFEAFKTDGVSAALQSVITDVQNLASEMGGAGFKAVAEFASGLMSGATSLITEAATFIADTIASYLIGSSPPPQGPLANIVQGGEAVIAAYVDGLKSGLTGIEDVAQGVVDALGNVDKTLTLEQGQAALKNAGIDMKALGAAADDVDGVLKSLGNSIQDNQSALQDYRNAVTDIKDAYEAAIDPLQRQLDALKEVNSLAEKQADIQSKIQLAQLKGELLKAQGDPVRRAQLQNQLDVLEQQEKGLTLQERQLALTKQSSDINTKNQVTQLREAALKAKQAGDTDKAKKLTEQAQALSLKGNTTSQAANILAQQKLELQQRQNALQVQLEGMVNKEAVARIKGQQAQVQAVKDQRDINEEIANLNRELQAAPIAAQIKDLQQQQQALIEPIQERIKATEREGQALQQQRQAWQGLKSDINDVLQHQRELAAEAAKATAQAKKDAKDAATASKEKALSTPTNLANIFKPEAITETATKVGESWLKGFQGYLQTNAARLIGGTLGSMLGGALFGPLGALAGGIFGARFVERMQQNFGSLENLGGLIAGKISDGLNIDTGKASNSIEAFGIIFETLRDRALAALESMRTGIIDKLKGAQGGMADFQGQWQQLFGSDSAGAQAGITAIDGINKALQALQLLMEGDVTGAVNKLKEAFAQFGNTGSLGVLQLSDSFEKLKGVLTELAPIVAGIATAFLVFKTLTIVATVITAVGAAFSVLSGAVGALASIFAVGSLELGVTGVGAAFGVLGLEVGGASTLLGSIVALLGGPVTVVIGLVAIAIGALAAAWIGNWFGIQEATATAIVAIQQGYAQLSEFLSSTTATVWQTLQDAWATGVQAVQTVWQTGTDLIKTVQTAMWNALTPENQQKIQELQALFSELWTLIQQLWTKGTQAVMATATQWWADIVKGSQDLWATITTGTQKLWEDINLYWDSGLKGIQELLAPAYKVITDATTALFTKLNELWEGAKTVLGPIAASLGETIMKAMTDAMNLAVGGVVDAVTGAVKKAIEAARGLLSQFSSETGSGSGGMKTMSYVTGGSKASPQLQNTINAVASKYGLPANIFTAQLQHESAGFDPNVLTGVRRGGLGEVGIGQFLPSTLRGLGVDIDTYLKDVNLQVETAAKYLASLVKEYGDIDKALQAYNGGPGGVGSPATQRYVNLVHQVADTLKTETNNTKLMSMSGGGTAGKMQLGIDQITAGKQAGLSADEAAVICGPYAAMLFAQFTGMNPTLQQAKELGAAVGWTAARGMGGTGNFMSLLGRMGINAVRQAATPENVNAALSAGNPVAFSTPRHYFVGSGGTAAGGINVGATGTVMGSRGGTANMTLDQITSVGGGMNDIIVLLGQVKQAGDETFKELTTVTGQYGETLTTQAVPSTQTLATHIDQGLVPAGLKARDAVGAMSIGIQPLIAQWANGAVTGDDLALSIVNLASQTGLSAEPLARYQQGNISVGEALRTVMTALATADPAFAQIQGSMSGADLTTQALANTLLQGLANVTGTVTTSISSMATGIAPLQTALAAGTISGEQFAQSVVELAATSGLTQAPLRQMQDGVLNTQQALTQVISAVAETNPGLKQLADNVASGALPVQESAQLFLDWVKAQAEVKTAAAGTSDAVERIPDAVTSIEQPMADAATTATQILPEATQTAMNSTVDIIKNTAGPAGDAAKAVGEAIVENIRSVVEGAASSLAEAAQSVVEKALDAARKAAEEVKKAASKIKSGGDDTDEKARGGLLGAGWTLVGEEGPELISPGGYVYTAAETTDMMMHGISSGLFTLHKYAKGKKKSKSKKKSSTSSSSTTAPARQSTPPYAEELNLQIGIIQRQQQIDKILFETYDLEQAIVAAKHQQELAAKGSLASQIQMAQWEESRLKNEAQIAEIETHAIPYRQLLAGIQQKINDAQKGSLANQIASSILQSKHLKNEYEINKLQLESAPMQQAATQLEEEINRILEGTIVQRKLIAANQLASLKLDQQALIEQAALIPINAKISDLQKEIDSIQRGTLEDQYKSIDLQTEAAQLRIKEIGINAQIRNINNGTLVVSQAEVNELQRQLEVINDQKAGIDEQNELRQLNATITNSSAQKQLIALNEEQLSHQGIIEHIGVEKSLIQNQTDQINNQNQISAAGQQAKLLELNNQLVTYNAQIANLQAQNAVLDLQVQNIELSNQIRADAFAIQLIQLQSQVAEYEAMTFAVTQQNELIAVQANLVTANNAVAAAGHAANILSLEAQAQKQRDIITSLNVQIGSLNAQKKIYEDIRSLADAIAAAAGAPVAPGLTSPSGGPPGTVVATADGGGPTLYLSRGTGTDGWYTADGRLIQQGATSNPPSGYRVHWLAEGGTWHKGEVAVLGENGPEIAIAPRDLHVFPHEQSDRIAKAFGRGGQRSSRGSDSAERNVTVQVEYHRHSGTDYGEGTLPQVIREAVHIALRS